MVACPKCKSTRIGYFRLDSDWANGAGNWNAWNKPENEAGYTQADMTSFEENERPEIECLICCQCSTFFNVVPNAVITDAQEANERL